MSSLRSLLDCVANKELGVADCDRRIKDYRITIKVRNNHILKAIEEAGGAPGGKWCNENGLEYKTINDFIRMKISPLLENGTLRPAALKLCEALNKLPEDLWSNDQLYPMEINFSELEMDSSQVAAMMANRETSYLPDFSEIENKQIRKLLDKAMIALSPREREVIKLIFEEDYTREEAGKELDVTAARIQQIESKALRKLRSYSSHKILKDCLDDSLWFSCYRPLAFNKRGGRIF